jgi:hypothetical protein
VIKTFIKYNANPLNKNAGDCVIRAISKATHKKWDDIYLALSAKGFDLKDWGNSNAVWDAYLRQIGYYRHIVPDTCPDCYTIREFAKDKPNGTYIVATGTHVVAVVDGIYFDTFDSGDMPVIYYYSRYWRD